MKTESPILDIKIVLGKKVVKHDARPGDIIVIPDYLGKGVDHALMVADTFPDKVNLFTPVGNKAVFTYDYLYGAKAYYIWERPAAVPDSIFRGGTL